MTPAERQYRRALRLLPAGCRQLWEEDMVSAYLDSVADSPRRSAAERLAVAWLALRLRLNGSHATPRAELWYQAVLGIAILTTIYEGLNATFIFAYQVGFIATVGIDATWPNHVAYWLDSVSLVWVATFVCLVIGRLRAARVLVLVALAHEFGLTSLIVAHTIRPNWGLPAFEASNMHQAWLLLTAVSVFLIPRTFRPSRGWLAAYIVAAVVTIPIAVATAADIGGRSSTPYNDQAVPPQWLQQLQLLNVSTFLRVGMILFMIVALVRARQWLLPLAAFGGGVAAVQLLGYHYGSDFLYDMRQRGSDLWTWVNVLQLLLAVACAVAGFVALRRARPSGNANP
jgi:hypothetical protein